MEKEKPLRRVKVEVQNYEFEYINDMGRCNFYKPDSNVNIIFECNLIDEKGIFRKTNHYAKFSNCKIDDFLGLTQKSFEDAKNELASYGWNKLKKKIINYIKKSEIYPLQMKSVINRSEEFEINFPDLIKEISMDEMSFECNCYNNTKGESDE